MNALKFYPSVNIELKRKDLIKKGDNYIGQVVQANFVKNRFGQPYRKAEYNLYYGEGIRKSEEAFEVAVDLGIITRGGAYYTFPLANGTTNRLMGKDNVNTYYQDNPLDFKYLEQLVVSSFKLKATDVVEAAEDQDFIEE